MTNLSTKDFCREFEACPEGTHFALKFDTMRECYDALLNGEAGDDSPEWAIWVATCEGVMSDCDLRLFAVRCARRVQHLMKDERSIKALDVAERYANGEVSDDELSTACASARAAWYAAWNDADAAAEVAARSAASAAAWYAADAAAWSATRAAACAAARDAVWANERREQLKLLAEFGNPFEEDEE